MDQKKLVEFRRRARPPGLTPKEAAAALGGSKWGWNGKLLRKLVRENKINGVVFGGRWYILQSEIDKLRAEQEKTLKLWEKPKYE